MYPIIRVDGHSFHRITKELCFQTPFDPEFRNLMIATATSVINCHEFDILLAYIQSDEISFLLHRDYNGYNRRSEKISTLFSAYATAAFNREVGGIDLGRGLSLQRQLPLITFDARVILIPNIPLVMRYLHYRQKDSLTNCINSYCYWKLVESGLNPRQASHRLYKLNFAQKNELLFSEFNINFNSVPLWEKRGTLISTLYELKECTNQKTGEPAQCMKRKLRVEDCPDFQNPDLLPAQGAMLLGMPEECVNNLKGGKRE
jgi:tRNA(His) 5'-end guanylyltransferase